MKITDYQDFTDINTSQDMRRKLDVGDIYANQGTCKDCGGKIRSKNRHNMAYCKCGKSAIDGGSWYVRSVGNIDYDTIYYNDRSNKEE